MTAPCACSSQRTTVPTDVPLLVMPPGSASGRPLATTSPAGPAGSESPVRSGPASVGGHLVGGDGGRAVVPEGGPGRRGGAGGVGRVGGLAVLTDGRHLLGTSAPVVPHVAGD